MRTFQFLLLGSVLIPGSVLAESQTAVKAAPGASAPVERQYYERLRFGCRRDGCCLESVHRMEQMGVQQVPEQGCANGAQKKSLPCKKSLQWCETKAQAKRFDVTAKPDRRYYLNLEKFCGPKFCCEDSVRRMKRGQYRLALDRTCPEGFEWDRVPCKTSYEWCVPKGTPLLRDIPKQRSKSEGKGLQPQSSKPSKLLFDRTD